MVGRRTKGYSPSDIVSIRYILVFKVLQILEFLNILQEEAKCGINTDLFSTRDKINLVGRTKLGWRG